MKNEEIVRWYIEQAIGEVYDPSTQHILPSINSVGVVIAYPKRYSEILFRALELAVGDVG